MRAPGTFLSNILRSVFRFKGLLCCLACYVSTDTQLRTGCSRTTSSALLSSTTIAVAVADAVVSVAVVALR